MHVGKVQMIDYETFGKLRFLDHFPKTDGYYCNDGGGETTCIGYACTEGYFGTAFAWRCGPEQVTGELKIDFEDCQPQDGHALLETLRLPLRQGMSSKEVLDLLGLPDPDAEEHPYFDRFILGSGSEYYVFCCYNQNDALIGVSVARRDLVDKYQNG